MNSRSGFTLLEALAAILLVGVVLPVGIAAVTQATRAAAQVERRALAMRLAESQLATLVATGAWATGSTSGTFSDEVDGTGAGAFTWRFAIVDRTTGGLRELQLTVESTVLTVPAVELSTLVPTASGS
jgi:type II secretory pathway pseudopilin PulG